MGKAVNLFITPNIGGGITPSDVNHNLNLQVYDIVETNDSGIVGSNINRSSPIDIEVPPKPDLVLTDEKLVQLINFIKELVK